MADNLTAAAVGGYQCEANNTGYANPFLQCSPNWFAYEAGAALARTGRCQPVKASMGRGYTVNVATAATRFVAKFDATNRVTLERKD